MKVSHLTDLDYDGRERLRMDFEGHPTDVIDHARRIAQEVLGNTAWHFSTIEGKLSDNALFPSEMKFKVVAVRSQ